MHDPPATEAVLDGIARLLRGELMADLPVRLRHEVRVAASLCALLAREARDQSVVDATERDELRVLLGHDAPLPELRHELQARLEQIDADTDFERAARDALLVIARAKVAIARPGYADYDPTVDRP